MEAAGNTLVTLHCATNGNYEPLQCDNGMCWCAQPRTGQPTVSPVPEEDMNLLPCCKYFVYAIVCDCEDGGIFRVNVSRVVSV